MRVDNCEIQIFVVPMIDKASTNPTQYCIIRMKIWEIFQLTNQ